MATLDPTILFRDLRLDHLTDKEAQEANTLYNVALDIWARGATDAGVWARLEMYGTIAALRQSIAPSTDETGKRFPYVDNARTTTLSSTNFAGFIDAMAEETPSPTLRAGAAKYMARVINWERAACGGSDARWDRMEREMAAEATPSFGDESHNRKKNSDE